jgi:hypothetical protein
MNVYENRRKHVALFIVGTIYNGPISIFRVVHPGAPVCVPMTALRDKPRACQGRRPQKNRS